MSHESEAYTKGWLAGYDALVLELNEGFKGNLPEWLLALIGGKKNVRSALKPAKSVDLEDDNPMEPDYDLGETDGYKELLDEVVEAVKTKREYVYPATHYASKLTLYFGDIWLEGGDSPVRRVCEQTEQSLHEPLISPFHDGTVAALRARGSQLRGVAGASLEDECDREQFASLHVISPDAGQQVHFAAKAFARQGWNGVRGPDVRTGDAAFEVEIGDSLPDGSDLAREVDFGNFAGLAKTLVPVVENREELAGGRLGDHPFQALADLGWNECC